MYPVPTCVSYYINIFRQSCVWILLLIQLFFLFFFFCFYGIEAFEESDAIAKSKDDEDMAETLFSLVGLNRRYAVPFFVLAFRTPCTSNVDDSLPNGKRQCHRRNNRSSHNFRLVRRHTSTRRISHLSLFFSLCITYISCSYGDSVSRFRWHFSARRPSHGLIGVCRKRSTNYGIVELRAAVLFRP